MHIRLIDMRVLSSTVRANEFYRLPPSLTIPLHHPPPRSSPSSTLLLYPFLLVPPPPQSLILHSDDRVGVVRKRDGTLHFFVNGIDQGQAAFNVPANVYGVIDLYGQAAQVLRESGVCKCFYTNLQLLTSKFDEFMT